MGSQSAGRLAGWGSDGRPFLTDGWPMTKIFFGWPVCLLGGWRMANGRLWHENLFYIKKLWFSKPRKQKYGNRLIPNSNAHVTWNAGHLLFWNVCVFLRIQAVRINSKGKVENTDICSWKVVAWPKLPWQSQLSSFVRFGVLTVLPFAAVVFSLRSYVPRLWIQFGISAGYQWSLLFFDLFLGALSSCNKCAQSLFEIKSWISGTFSRYLLRFCECWKLIKFILHREYVFNTWFGVLCYFGRIRSNLDRKKVQKMSLIW